MPRHDSSALAELQRRFAASIRERHDDAAALVADDGVPPELRLAIHRNNTYASLLGVLAGAFPRLAGLLGERRFRSAAAAYIGEAPPRRPQLAEYGREFPAFLEHFAPAADLPWLADLARLEWARHEAFFAADSPALTADALAQVPPEHYGNLRLRLHPAVRRVTADYPVDRLWEATSMPPDIARQATSVLVMRPELAVVHAVIEPAEAAFLAATAAGKTLDEAAAAALAHDSDYDLSAALARYLSRAVFTANTLNGQDGCP